MHTREDYSGDHMWSVRPWKGQRTDDDVTQRGRRSAYTTVHSFCRHLSSNIRVEFIVHYSKRTSLAVPWLSLEHVQQAICSLGYTWQRVGHGRRMTTSAARAMRPDHQPFTGDNSCPRAAIESPCCDRWNAMV